MESEFTARPGRDPSARTRRRAHAECPRLTIVPDVFVSYCKSDRKVAKQIAAALTRDGWDVFWDREIAAGSEWSSDLQRALQTARCVVVLWSTYASQSFWVRAEAADAYERNVYLPCQLDETQLPRLFRGAQTHSLAEWLKNGSTAELDGLRSLVQERIGAQPAFGNLEPVADGSPVTTAHLHLVHSAWRVDRPTRFGVMPHRIHVILFGHASALARVNQVHYTLPGYPEGHDSVVTDDTARLFELKELANGFCIVQAAVELRDQPPGHPRVLRLSRFVNMSESGPRLLETFARRTSRSNLGAKLHSLPVATEEARSLLATLAPEDAVARLIASGTPPAIAENAVFQARTPASPPES